MSESRSEEPFDKLRVSGGRLVWRGDYPSIRALRNAAVGSHSGAMRCLRGLLGGISNTRSNSRALSNRNAVPDGHASAFAHRGPNTGS